MSPSVLVEGHSISGTASAAQPRFQEMMAATPAAKLQNTRTEQTANPLCLL